MDNLADEALVRLYLTGERMAFAELVRRYQKQIYSLAYRLTSNSEDALDLSQEVFLKLCQVLSKYDESRPFFPWMYKVACNVCYSALRKKPQDTVPLEKVMDLNPLMPGQDSQPEVSWETKEVQELVRQAMAELPDKYRLPLVLRYLEDMTYQQIADSMELPVSTIETRLFRGKSLLQKRLVNLVGRGVHRELSRG